MSQIEQLREFLADKADIDYMAYSESVIIDKNWSHEELNRLRILVEDTIREKIEVER